MIKRNKALLHLDLSQVNLTEYMLWHIGKALTRARSVISLHLSGNQGVTPTLIEQLRTRIRCQPQPQEMSLKIAPNRGIDVHNPMLSTMKGRFRKYDEMVVQERMNMRHIHRQHILNGEI